jgi:tRNA(Ile2) C34 agmatinyltransferase TiaS
MVIKLLGELANNTPVLKPVTVKAKPKCVTCGHQNKATANFCNKCGTALEIFA